MNSISSTNSKPNYHARRVSNSIMSDAETKVRVTALTETQANKIKSNNTIYKLAKILNNNSEKKSLEQIKPDMSKAILKKVSSFFKSIK